MDAVDGTFVGAAPFGHRCQTPIGPVSGKKFPRLTVLIGLNDVYAHGLCSALTDAGQRCYCLPALDHLAATVEVADHVLLVVPETQSAEVQEAVPTSRRGRVRMAVLLPDGDPQTYRRGLATGAAGVVPAQADLTDMISVLRSAQHNRTILPVPVLRALVRSASTVAGDLSDVERGWLTDLAAGRTVGELARGYLRSEREMYRALGRVYRRLGAENRSAAILAAQRAGLLT